MQCQLICAAKSIAALRARTAVITCSRRQDEVLRIAYISMNQHKVMCELPSRVASKISFSPTMQQRLTLSVFSTFTINPTDTLKKQSGDTMQLKFGCPPLEVFAHAFFHRIDTVRLAYTIKFDSKRPSKCFQSLFNTIMKVEKSILHKELGALIFNRVDLSLNLITPLR